jgi:mRNA interferase RelE/StbE
MRKRIVKVPAGQGSHRPKHKAIRAAGEADDDIYAGGDNNVAIAMPFRITLMPEAIEDLRGLDARIRSVVRTAIETHLRHEPRKTSRSRIKRLRRLDHPQYRLRVDDVRVFYDVVDDARVEVLAIISKTEAERWLAQFENLG